MTGTTMEKDNYEVLGVKPDSSQDEIRRAYRELARKYHPDKTGGDTVAEDKLKEINAAYDILKNVDKRKEYDKQRTFGAGFGGRSGGFDPRGGGFEFHTSGPGEFSDIFESIFGGGAGFQTGQQVRRPRPGRDIETSVTVTLQEIAKGTKRSVRIQREESVGNVATRELKVDIPAGMDSGMRLRVPGEGGPGVNDGPRGDLYVRVEVAPDPFFKREGRDIVCEVPVRFTDAALGATVRVPTLDATANLTIPAGTQNDARLRLRGLGLPGRNGEAPGDQYVQVKVEVPVKLSKEQTQLLREFAGDEFEPKSNPLVEAFRALLRKLRGVE